ncbi:MAG: PAS domain S-box protein [Oligoflexia bacterium]|nr:PAS domain S-box protein [Oligoflexia bacterium]
MREIFLKIDIRTLIFVTGIGYLVQFIILSLQHRVNKRYKGTGWWMASSAFALVGFCCFFLRDPINGNFIVQGGLIFFGNFLLLVGSVLIYIGIVRFFEKSENRLVITSILTAFILSYLYYTFFSDNIVVRTIIMALSVTTILCLTIRDLYIYKIKAINFSVSFVIAVIVFHIIILLSRAIVAITSDSFGNILASTPSNVLLFLHSTVGSVLLMIGIVTMVSQRLVEDNNDAKEMIEKIFNSSVDPTVVSRMLDGRIIMVNSGFERLYGLSREEAVGKTVYELNFWSDFKDRQKMIDLLKESGVCENFESEFKDKNGVKINGLVSAKIVNLQDGLYIAASMRDITKLKKYEKERLEFEKQLFHAEKLATIGTLAAGVAHEINNPLTVIMGNISLLREECKYSCKKNNIPLMSAMYNGTKRIATIIDGLRVYSRMDTDQIESVDVHKCIDEVVCLLHGIYQKENIRIELSLNAQNYIVKANSGKMKQVILNIITNAKDALIEKNTENEGVIKVITMNEGKDKDSKDGNLIVEISDNGNGINKDVLVKLFDPFFTTKPPGKGTGLGLSICQSIIRSFTGTISVESREGVGSTFKVLIPV